MYYAKPANWLACACLLISCAFVDAEEKTAAGDGTGRAAGKANDTTVDDAPVSFANDIQPIFARACTGCHGGVKQAGDLSFVSPDSILPPDGWVIEPGDPEESILYQRLVSTSPEERMPPPEEHPEPLSQREIDLIYRWIKAGAKWEAHWARTPLAEANPPVTVTSNEWAKTSLDHFVFDRLTEKSLQPSKQASPGQWLRRVSFDLIGLPPTPDEIASFNQRLAACDGAADRPSAVETIYRNEVQRLLASPRFGERWASMWMDLARYADSQGFEKDPHRDMWPYRDWLIDAFNADMPYDEFTIKQLAGDLLPNAKYEDVIATAFHRNTQTNTEGGTDDEEYRIAAVIDRLSTTWTTWQATTFGCVQCHSHPYEPYEHDEFYAGLSLFNNTEDVDLNSETPTIPYLKEASDRNEFLRVQRSWMAQRNLVDSRGRQAVLQSEWQPLNITSTKSTSGTIGVVDSDIRVVAGTVSVGSTYTIDATVPENTVPENTGSIHALKIWIRPESDNPADWPEQGSVLSTLKMQIVPVDGKPRDVVFDVVIPDHRSGIDGIGESDCDELFSGNKKGFGGFPKLFAPRWVAVVPKEPIAIMPDQTIRLSMAQKASVTGGLSNHMRRLAIQFTASDSITQLVGSEDYRQQRHEVAQLKRQWRAFKGTPIPVMLDRRGAAKRTTRKFLRGNWLERGDIIEPKIPDAFQPSDPTKQVRVTDRLEFAKWLVSDENPLAARVWVNRVWAELFGTGIVVTLEDFGASGQPPSDPALLDHLASRMRQGYRWSLKTLLESIVLSATYRQDSSVSKELRELDARNQWLARGPRTRLTAEMVRDQALLAAGVLTNKVGGPSVMPPQPDGVWQQVYSSNRWTAAKDEDRFRRGVYTYWKRTSPYPGFVMFDTPSRDICSPRRIATNTPLQALVTLNSEVYTELAGKLALRCQVANDGDVKAAIADMFLHVVSRPPGAEDLTDLMELYDALQADDQVGLDPDSQANDGGLSPLGIVALAILNSDWAITK